MLYGPTNKNYLIWANPILFLGDDFRTTLTLVIFTGICLEFANEPVVSSQYSWHSPQSEHYVNIYGTFVLAGQYCCILNLF